MELLLHAWVSQHALLTWAPCCQLLVALTHAPCPQPCPPLAGIRKAPPASSPSPSWVTSTRAAPAPAAVTARCGVPPRPTTMMTASGASAPTKVRGPVPRWTLPPASPLPPHPPVLAARGRPRPFLMPCRVSGEDVAGSACCAPQGGFSVRLGCDFEFVSLGCHDAVP